MDKEIELLKLKIQLLEKEIELLKLKQQPSVKAIPMPPYMETITQPSTFTVSNAMGTVYMNPRKLS